MYMSALVRARASEFVDAQTQHVHIVALQSKMWARLLVVVKHVPQYMRFGPHSPTHLAIGNGVFSKPRVGLQELSAQTDDLPALFAGQKRPCFFHGQDQR